MDDLDSQFKHTERLPVNRQHHVRSKTVFTGQVRMTTRPERKREKKRRVTANASRKQQRKAAKR